MVTPAPLVREHLTLVSSWICQPLAAEIVRYENEDMKNMDYSWGPKDGKMRFVQNSIQIRMKLINK